MNKGLIFNIQRFSTKDGPGIRTTVFTMGCNLNCLWCHNPESISGEPLLKFNKRRCTDCGACADACRYGAVKMINGKRTWNSEACTLCGDCVRACGYNALEITGREYTAEEVYTVLMKDQEYYLESGGGVTFSGGEPLLQSEFVAETMRMLKIRGIHTALDTAFSTEWTRIEEVLPWTDLFLVDIKGMDWEKHLANTGVYPDQIHENLRKLARENVEIVVRLPLVKGLNDGLKEVRAAVDFITGWKNLVGVELLPYHNLGVEKSDDYEALPKQPGFSAPDEQFLKRAAEAFRSAGIRVL